MTLLTDAPSRVLDHVESVGRDDLERISLHAPALTSKAMQLTDSWGQAMFIMDPSLVNEILTVLGFASDVSSHVYEAVRGLAYVRRFEGAHDKGPEFTWHALDATCLVLRGCADLDSAMAEITDSTVNHFLESHTALFERVMAAIPDYASKLMFSPEVASTVVATLGGLVSADRIYDLASAYGRQSTRDIEGRRGVSTQFIRSLTLTISARAGEAEDGRN